MPEMRTYVVTQTREVKVNANTSLDAVMIAAAAFEYGQNSQGRVPQEYMPDVPWGYTSDRIKELSLETRRKS